MPSLVLLASLSVVGCSLATVPPPDILLVTLDTTRADHSSAYGYARETTPQQRRLARDGVLFEQAYAPAGMTGTSHATLFSSLHPITHRLLANGMPFVESHETLAERLRGHGYQTAAIVSSFVLDRKFGFDQGFDHYDDQFSKHQATMDVKGWEGFRVPGAFDRRADFTSDRAIDWLESARDPSRRFFLFVHFMDAHAPYSPPKEFTSRFGGAKRGRERAIQLYDGEIAFVDQEMGRLLDALDELGLTDTTLVVVTADHGEGLGERGYFNHSYDLSEEEVRVPLLVRWPQRIPQGRISQPVELADVMPTLLELAGVSPNGARVQGRSLARVLAGVEPLDPDAPIHLYRRNWGRTLLNPGTNVSEPLGFELRSIQVHGEKHALREGPWKYVFGPQERSRILYNLTTDPGETTNIFNTEREIGEMMHTRLSRWIVDNRVAEPLQNDLTEDDRTRLRALGYVD